MWRVMAISFLAGMSTPVGGWIVLRFKHLATRTLALFLGLAAGVMVTVVITELMPASIRSGGRSLFLTGAASGWLFMWVVRMVLVRLMKQRAPAGANHTFLQMGWFIAIAIALHDIPEGLAIGAGNAVEEGLGLLIALAIALHNIPEGMSIAAPLRLGGVKRSTILVITAATGLVTPIGTAVSLWLFSVSSLFVALSLAFASGAMTFVVANDIFPEALQQSLLYTAVGMALGTGSMVAMAAMHP